MNRVRYIHFISKMFFIIKRTFLILYTDQISLPLFLEMIEAMDPQADPCEDFYQYACGGWIKSNSIPDSQNVYNRFHELISQNTKTLIKLLTNLIEKNDTSTVSD